MSKQYYDENGNPVEVKKKRGGCLKWIIGIVALLTIFVACTATLGGDSENTTTENTEGNAVVDEQSSEESQKENRDQYFSTNRIDEATGIEIRETEVTTPIGNEVAIAGFGQEMWMDLKENHDTYENGVIYIGKHEHNTHKQYDLIAYFSSDNIERLDFDDIINEAESYIYADHYLIRGFGEVDLEIPSQKDPRETISEDNPYDVLWLKIVGYTEDK